MSSRYERVPLGTEDDDGAVAAPSRESERIRSPRVTSPAASASTAASTPSRRGFSVGELFSIQGVRTVLRSVLGDAPPETPAACVRQFMNHLRSTYLSPSARLPAFQETSVEEALAQSNRTLKPLLIYLHTDLHESSAQFVRQTLSDPVFCDFIEQTFVVWGASVHNTDGFAAASKFSAAGFPFIGVYAPVSGSTVSRPKYQRVWSHEDGFISTNALKSSLQGACASVLTSLETIQADRQSQIFERQLREDQERQYKEAEERDMQTMIERAEKQRNEAIEQARLEDAKELEEAISLSKELHKESIVASARRRLEQHPEPPTGTDTCLVRFTLPTAVKLQRRFLSADSLQTVRDYVVVATTELGAPLHNFDLSTNYPKRLFSSSHDDSKTLKDVGLPQQVMFFVTQTPEQLEMDKTDAARESAA